MSLKISYDQAIASAKRILRLSQTTIHDDEIEKLIDWGCKQLTKINITSVLCAELEIDCYSVKLPDNCHKDEILCFTLNGGCTCGGCGNVATTTTAIEDPDGTVVTVSTTIPAITGSGGCPPIYASPLVLSDFCGQGGNASYWLNVYDISGGYIKVPSSCNATTMNLYYIGKYMDSAGLMVIDDDWEAALSYFSAWQFSLSYNELYTPQQTDSWMRMWEAQRGYLGSTQQMVEFKKRKPFIRGLANAILVDRNPITSLF